MNKTQAALAIGLLFLIAGNTESNWCHYPLWFISIAYFGVSMYLGFKNE